MVKIYDPIEGEEYYLNIPLKVAIDFEIDFFSKTCTGVIPYISKTRGFVMLLDRYNRELFHEKTTDRVYDKALDVSKLSAGNYKLKAGVEFKWCSFGSESEWTVAADPAPAEVNIILKAPVITVALDVSAKIVPSSTPISVDVVYDTMSFKTPKRLYLEKGKEYIFTAKSLVNILGVDYEFVRWSDGMTSTVRTKTLYENETLELEYEAIPACTHGDREILEYCPDGVTVKRDRICQADGTWGAEKVYSCPCYPEGTTQCENYGVAPYRLLKCVGGTWQEYKTNAVECGYKEEKEEKPWWEWFTEQTIAPGVPNWVFVAVPIGAGVGITLAALALRRKQ